MSSCLYLTPEELKKYSALGVNLHEINRDYLEKGVLRSPMAIKNKLDVRNSETQDLYFEKQIQEDLIRENERHDHKISENWISQLSTSLGVKSKIVSEQEASAIHTAKQKKYSGEPAFFVDGIAYFVERTLTPESVLHEFSHPIIKSLDASVRTSLYTSLISEEFGQKILEEVQSLYTEDVTQEQIEEEVLVRALVKSVEELGATPRIKSIFDNFLFHIKQALRKLLGRSVNVANLKADTTLKDLAEMISKGDVLELQKEMITSSDIIEHFKVQEEFVNGFDNVLNKDAQGFQDMIGQMFDIATEMKKDINENEAFFPFAEVFLDEYRTGILDQIVEKLGISAVASKAEVVHHILATEEGKMTAEKVKERIMNFSHTLFKLQELYDVMNRELIKMESLDSKEKIDRLIYYKKFIDAWGSHINQFNEYSRWEKESPLKTLAESLKTSLSNAQNQVKKLQVEALEDIIFESLEGPAKSAKEQFEKEVSIKKQQKAPQAIIDRMYTAFHNMKEAEYKTYKELKGSGRYTDEYRRLHDRWLAGSDFNREKVKALLNGETPDANFFNSKLESLSLNTDPAVSSLYDHIQKLTAEYQAQSLNFYNRFIIEVLPHIEKNGAQFQNRGALGRKMGFKDTVGKLNEETKQIEKVEEWTFLNPWKDYRHDEMVLKNAAYQARETYKETNNDNDKKVWLKAERDYQLWKNEYMHQRYTAEYYEAKDLLMKDDIGIDAKEKLQVIQEELNLLMNDNEGGKHDLIIDTLKTKMSSLYLSHDEFGVKKTGRELEVAERLQEYRKARSEFFIDDEVPNMFQDAYNEHEAILEERGLSEDAIKIEMENWLKRNTRVVLKNSVHDKRQKLLDEKAKILSLLSEENKKIFDTEKQERLIADQVNLVKDTGNQANGNEATEEARQKVLDAHKQIEEARLLQLTKLGLTGAESKRYSELRKIYTSAGKVWNDPALEQEFTALMQKKEAQAGKFGLNAEAIARIQEIDSILSKMSDTLPTDYYKEVVIRMLSDQNLEGLLMEFAEESGYVYNHIGEALNDDILEFINSEQGQKAMDQSSDFKRWVEQNHYEKNDKNSPTKIWMLTQSADPYDYKTKRLTNRKGEDLGLIKINDTYRVPSSQFYTRVVKDKYVTPETEGITVDNRGNFLPKNESTGRYVNHEYEKMKKEDPENFEFMETLKNTYLEGQSESDRKDRTYLAYPKVQKTTLENVVTGNLLTWGRRWREFWNGREDDVFEYKTATSKFRTDQDMLKGLGVTTDVSAPVIGIYGPENINDISTDILKTIPEYVASLNHKKAAQKANSYAQMMKDHFENTAVDKRDWKTNARSLANKNYTMSLDNQFEKDPKHNRAEIIKALIERDINGIQLSGVGADYRRMNKLLGSLTKRSAKMNFNWNLMSGVVNFGQNKITSLTHTLAGDEVNFLQGLKGEAWAFKTMSKISKDIRKRGLKSLEEQILNTFDPVSGRTDEVIGDSMSRTLMSDVLEGKLAQTARKWMELEGTVQNFGALMYKKTVSITDEQGNTKEIPYIEAFELVDGLLQSKKGVDPYYAIGYDSEGKFTAGEGFYEHRNYMQNVIMKWNGAFAKKDAALVSRNVLAKQMMFLKKHVIPLASKQYSFAMGTWKKGEMPKIRKRMNWTTGVAEFGHTISTFRTIHNWINYAIEWQLPRATKSEMKSLLFTANQLIIGYVVLPYLYSLVTPMLGTDDDDEDEIERPNFQAMKYRSGYFEGLLTAEQNPNYFQEQGYLLNMMSMVSLKLKDEYNSVNWALHPTGMMDAFSQGTSQSIGIVQTFKFYKDAVGMLAGQKKVTPSKTTGPYIYQQEGYKFDTGIPGVQIGGNLIELMFKWQGINAGMIDPTGKQQAYISAKQTK